MCKITLVRTLIRELQIMVNGHIQCLSNDIKISIALLSCGFSSNSSTLTFHQFIKVRQMLVSLGTRDCYQQFCNIYLPKNMKITDISLLCKYKLDATLFLKNKLCYKGPEFNDDEDYVSILVPPEPEDASEEWTTSTGNIIIKQRGKIFNSILSLVRYDQCMIQIYALTPWRKRRQQSVVDSEIVQTIGIIVDDKYLPIFMLAPEFKRNITLDMTLHPRLREISQSMSFHWLTAA